MYFANLLHSHRYHISGSMYSFLFPIYTYTGCSETLAPPQGETYKRPFEMKFSGIVVTYVDTSEPSFQAFLSAKSEIMVNLVKSVKIQHF